jgi:uncharacterized membrane protein
MKFMPNVDSVNKRLKQLAIAMMIVSFLGFVDSAYLTVDRYLGASLPCTLTHSCDAVTSSEYSTVLGIPVVILGIAYYLTILLGAYFYLEYRSRKYFKLVAALTVTGFAFSFWLTYVQAFILKEFCQYCLLSGLTSTILFLLGLAVFKTFAPYRSPNANGQE